VGSLYDIEIKQRNGKVIDINFNKNDKGRAKEVTTGKYILRTNRKDLDAKEILKLYRSLTTIEDSFRSMKSGLGLRPNYHHQDEPTIAHIYITVIAYHILRAILRRLRQRNIQYNWPTLRNILITHSRASTTLNTDDDFVWNIRTTASPTAEQYQIYSHLNLRHTPLKRLIAKFPINKNVVVTKKMPHI